MIYIYIDLSIVTLPVRPASLNWNQPVRGSSHDYDIKLSQTANVSVGKYCNQQKSDQQDVNREMLHNQRFVVGPGRQRKTKDSTEKLLEVGKHCLTLLPKTRLRIAPEDLTKKLLKIAYEDLAIKQMLVGFLPVALFPVRFLLRFA